MKRILLIIVTITTILVGCTNQPQELENVELRILTFNGSEFNEKYGNFFIATHPNYTLHMISIMENYTFGENFNEVVEELILTENPDVVSLNMDLYSSLLEQNKLSSLSPWIKKSKFDTSHFIPGIIDYFTDDQNQIHGLTPTFDGTALFYNKKMFTDNGIAFPKDSMTWREVLQLAQRFPNLSDTNEQQFGYYDRKSENPFLMALNIGETNGLSFYYNDKFTFSSRSWEGVFQHVTDCFKSKVCYEKESLDTPSLSGITSLEKSNYPFLAGNIAMAIHDSSLYRTLTTSKDRFPDLEWGVVSVPISEEQEGLSNGVMMNDILSIPTSAGQAVEAWELIEYIAGEDYARLLPNLRIEDLPARLPSEWKDENVKPFYELDRITNTTINTLRSLPASVVTTMDEVPNKYIADILSDRMGVPEALRMIESELQKVHDVSDK